MMHWRETKDGDSDARALFHRHYSHKPYKDGREPKLFVGPGFKLVLLSPCKNAMFVWRKFKSGDGQEGINCAVFRNEGAGRSSALLFEAMLIAWRRWPGERFYTYVKASAVRSANPGYCFKVCGWKFVGRTKWNKLDILVFDPGVFG